MEQDVLDAIASIGGRDTEFRQQVDRMRSFKERMKDAGVEVEPNKFRISLAEGLVPPRKVMIRM